LSPAREFVVLGSQWGKPRFPPLGFAHPSVITSGIRFAVTPFLKVEFFLISNL
jgi:hypothetical protein